MGNKVKQNYSRNKGNLQNNSNKSDNTAVSIVANSSQKNTEYEDYFDNDLGQEIVKRIPNLVSSHLDDDFLDDELDDLDDDERS